MRIPMTIEGVRLIEDGLWEGWLREEDFRVFHASSKTYGAVSMLVVNDPSVNFDQHVGRITFDLIKARLANKGDSDRVIIVRGCEARREPITSGKDTAASDKAWSRGDERFLRALRVLPREVSELGRELLAEIRAEFGGGFKYHPISKSYVQSPDKF
jgi:hypothetical protein